MKKKLLFLVIGLQTLFLLGLVFQQERTLKNGKLIMLETVPVDPRDLLRGDYVILSYPMSSIPLNTMQPSVEVGSQGKTIYVLLEQHGKFYEKVAASYERLEPSQRQILLVGTDVTAWSDPSMRRIDYGLERFYVPEGKGQLPWNKKITVEVAVPASGKPVLKDLFVDGIPFREFLKQPKS